MFDRLTEKLDNIFKSITGKGKLSVKTIEKFLRELRVSFLEADVNYKVVEDFIQNVREQALSIEVMQSFTPEQSLVNIVNEKLVNMLGKTAVKLELKPSKLNIFVIVGLQGSGKTTTIVKLAEYFRSESVSPVVVSCDVYRPAAVNNSRYLLRKTT